MIFDATILFELTFLIRFQYQYFQDQPKQAMDPLNAKKLRNDLHRPYQYSLLKRQTAIEFYEEAMRTMLQTTASNVNARVKDPLRYVAIVLLNEHRKKGKGCR